jgi:hypothetical protein
MNEKKGMYDGGGSGRRCGHQALLCVGEMEERGKERKGRKTKKEGKEGHSLLLKRSSASDGLIEHFERLVNRSTLNRQPLASAGIDRALQRRLRYELASRVERVVEKVGGSGKDGRRRSGDGTAAGGAFGDDVGEHSEICEKKRVSSVESSSRREMAGRTGKRDVRVLLKRTPSLVTRHRLSTPNSRANRLRQHLNLLRLLLDRLRAGLASERAAESGVAAAGEVGEGGEEGGFFIGFIGRRSGHAAAGAVAGTVCTGGGGANGGGEGVAEGFAEALGRIMLGRDSLRVSGDETYGSSEQAGQFEGSPLQSAGFVETGTADWIAQTDGAALPDLRRRRGTAGSYVCSL